MSKKPVILCVDDEKIVLQAIKSQIRDFVGSDYTIETAERGEFALEITDELVKEGVPISIAIVDYLMPSLKGDKVMIEIHKRSPKTLCIMLTGQSDLEAVTNAINNESLFRFMSKPWNKEDLHMTIQEVFYRQNLEKSLEEHRIELVEKNKELMILNTQLNEKIELFYRFVPSDFLNYLNLKQDLNYVELGLNRELELAVLFVDIRSFTILSESYSCSETFELINEFTKKLSPIVTDTGGFIDKFIGDGVLCIFLKPDDALECAKELVKTFSNQPIGPKGVKIEIGCSINYGPVQMGTVGYSKRMQTTVLGKTVNIAAKIEKLNKNYHTKILITEEVSKLANKDKYKFVFVDNVLLPGLAQEQRLYTLDT